MMETKDNTETNITILRESGNIRILIKFCTADLMLGLAIE